MYIMNSGQGGKLDVYRTYYFTITKLQEFRIYLYSFLSDFHLCFGMAFLFLIRSLEVGIYEIHISVCALDIYKRLQNSKSDLLQTMKARRFCLWNNVSRFLAT